MYAAPVTTAKFSHLTAKRTVPVILPAITFFVIRGIFQNRNSQSYQKDDERPCCQSNKWFPRLRDEEAKVAPKPVARTRSDGTVLDHLNGTEGMLEKTAHEK